MKKIKRFFKTVFIVVFYFRFNYKLYKQHCRFVGILFSILKTGVAIRKRNSELIKQAITTFNPAFGEYITRKEKILL